MAIDVSQPSCFQDELTVQKRSTFSYGKISSTLSVLLSFCGCTFQRAQEKKRKYSLFRKMCDVTVCQCHVLSTLGKCCAMNHACSFVMLQWIPHVHFTIAGKCLHVRVVTRRNFTVFVGIGSTFQILSPTTCCQCVTTVCLYVCGNSFSWQLQVCCLRGLFAVIAKRNEKQRAL